MKVHTVGGAGGSGATVGQRRIRRLDEHAEITAFERSDTYPMRIVGFPYYIGDVITDPEELHYRHQRAFLNASTSI